MMSLRWGIPKKVTSVRQKPLAMILGVVAFEPRPPSLEHVCLPTRVQSNALMRTEIAVYAAF